MFYLFLLVFVCRQILQIWFLLRVNIESVQTEANGLLKRLNDSIKKVSKSIDEVKEQYAKVLEVSLAS